MEKMVKKEKEIKVQIREFVGNNPPDFGVIKSQFPEATNNTILYALKEFKKEAVRGMVERDYITCELEGKVIVFDKKAGAWTYEALKADFIRTKYKVSYDFLSTFAIDSAGWAKSLNFDTYKNLFFKQRGEYRSFFVSGTQVYGIKKNIVDKIEWKRFPDLFVNDVSGFTNMENNEKLTVPLFHDIKFSFDYYQKIKKGEIKYEETKAYKFINDIANGDKDLTNSFFALIGKVSQRNSDIGTIAILKGGGRNGKTTLLKLIENIIGKSCSPNTNQNQISFAGKADINTLYGRSVLLYEENTDAINYAKSKLYTALKEMTSKTPTKNLDIKFRKDSCRIICPQNHVFATNLINELPDDTNTVAFLRRHKFFEMPALFKEFQSFKYNKHEYNIDKLLENKDFLIEVSTIAIYIFAKDGADVIMKGEAQRKMELSIRSRTLLFLDRFFKKKGKDTKAIAEAPDDLYTAFEDMYRRELRDRTPTYQRFFELLNNLSIKKDQINITNWTEYYVGKTTGTQGVGENEIIVDYCEITKVEPGEEYKPQKGKNKKISTNNDFYGALT